MLVDVAIMPSEALRVEDQAVAVIDVLRATTSVITAMANGCRAIMPVSTMEEARKKKQLMPEALLAGERDGLMSEGFDLGNSPLEYRATRVRGNSIIMTTTNGTRAFERVRQADSVFTAAFINANAAARTLYRRRRDVTIVCAGHNGGFSFEDALCAGMITEQIRLQSSRVELTDKASWAVKALDGAGLAGGRPDRSTLMKLMSGTVHGRYLHTIGAKSDITWAARLNHYRIIPYLSAGKLIL